MKNAAPALIALVVAVLALAVALFRAPERPLDAPASLAAAPSGADGLGPRIASLEAEVAKHAEEIAFLRSSPSTAREEVGVPGTEYEDMRARLAELQRELDGLRAAPPTLAKFDASARGPGAGAVEPKPTVEDWIRDAKDAVATDEERIAALKQLRGARMPDGTDARLGVLPEMIRLAEDSQNADVRADVWRQLSHVTERSLLQPLLRALQNDPSGEVREEASETLADFLPDPGVESALRFAAENDSDPDVRRQALESLSGRRR